MPDADRVMLVLPERQSLEIDDLVQRARDAAKQHDLTVKAFRTSRGRVTGEPWERPALFLEPQDARQLYGALHRSRALVLSFTQIYVRRDPSRDVSVPRRAITLEEFVRHKAVFRLVRGRPHIPTAFAEFRAWRSIRSCDGENDPRVLPLHVFVSRLASESLAAKMGRESFDKRYGRGDCRTDDDGKTWNHGPDHGSERLSVAGYQLPRGMHWDVTTQRAKARLTNTHEVWILRRASSYLNVYPDGYVSNRGSRRSTARRVWP